MSPVTDVQGYRAISEPNRPEIYTHGYEEWARRWMAQRTVVRQAGFLLPHLRPGMRLLDCGCGPGSITADLATILAPGAVVGIDIEPRQLEVARVLAAERGVKNLSFELGSIYELPFPDASFDAAFAPTTPSWSTSPTRSRRSGRCGGS